MSKVTRTKHHVTSSEAVELVEREIEQRYFAAINRLYDDAMEQDCDFILADVLAWTLARVLTHSGMNSDRVLQELNRYVRKLAESECDGCARLEVQQERAEVEAELARQVQRQPQ